MNNPASQACTPAYNPTQPLVACTCPHNAHPNPASICYYTQAGPCHLQCCPTNAHSFLLTVLSHDQSNSAYSPRNPTAANLGLHQGASYFTSTRPDTLHALHRTTGAHTCIPRSHHSPQCTRSVLHQPPPALVSDPGILSLHTTHF